MASLLALTQHGCREFDQSCLAREVVGTLEVWRVEVGKCGFRSDRDVESFMQIGRNQSSAPLWRHMIFVVNPDSVTNVQPLAIAPEPYFYETSVFLSDGKVIHLRDSARLVSGRTHEQLSAYVAAVSAGQAFTHPPSSASFVLEGKWCRAR